MKIMISQPMNGKSDTEILEERQSLKTQLESQGYEVVDTFITEEINDSGDNLGIRYLAKSIEFIAQVDGLIFLPGWQEARGCVIEHEVARRYGKWIKEM